MTLAARTASWLIATSLSAPWLASCAELPAPGSCGNHIHEPELGEDCDDNLGACNSSCRLTCDQEACPDGYACGLDGICARPSGRLGFAKSLVSFAPEFFEVLDYDGDSIGDVVGIGQSSFEVRYGSSTADLGRSYHTVTTQLTPNGARPALSVSPEGIVAAVIPSANGITAYFNAGDDLVPLPTPALGSAIDVIGATVACNDVCAAAAEDCEDACQLAAIGSYNGQSVMVIGQLDPIIEPCGPSATTGSLVAIATLHGRTEDILVVATSGAVCWFDLSGNELDRTNQVDTVTNLVIADLDGDGCEDIVVNDFGGLGMSEAHRVISPGGLGCGLVAIGAPSPDRLLGGGDIDVNPVADLVLPDGIHFNGAAFPSFPPGQVTITRAVVADVNRDGHADVVAIADDTLVVFQGGDQGMLVRFPDISARVSSLAVADLDGDTFPDVVSAESQFDGGLLLVSFGSPQGLEPAVAFGYADALQDTLTATVRTVAGILRSDVVVTNRNADTGTGEAVRYRVNDRSIAPVTPIGGTPLGVLMAALLPPGTAGPVELQYPDIVAFSLNTFLEPQLLFIPGGGVNDQGLPTNSAPPFFGTLPPSFFPADPGARAPALATISLGGAHAIASVRRDAVFAADIPLASGPLDLLLTVPVVPTGTDPPAQTTITVTLGMEPPPGVYRIFHQLHAVQLDGDDDSELIAIVFDYGTCVPMGGCEVTPHAFLIDLGPTGTTATVTQLDELSRFTAAGLATYEDRVGCWDGVGIDLGPDGPYAASPGGIEVGERGPTWPESLVLSCLAVPTSQDDQGNVVQGEPVSFVVGYASRDGQLVGPTNLQQLTFIGELAAGDVTGDLLEDLVIHIGDVVGVMVQCPRHDLDGC